MNLVRSIAPCGVLAVVFAAQTCCHVLKGRAASSNWRELGKLGLSGPFSLPPVVILLKDRGLAILAGRCLEGSLSCKAVEAVLLALPTQQEVERLAHVQASRAAKPSATPNTWLILNLQTEDVVGLAAVFAAEAGVAVLERSAPLRRSSKAAGILGLHHSQLGLFILVLSYKAVESIFRRREKDVSVPNLAEFALSMVLDAVAGSSAQCFALLQTFSGPKVVLASHMPCLRLCDSAASTIHAPIHGQQADHIPGHVRTGGSLRVGFCGRWRLHSRDGCRNVRASLATGNSEVTWVFHLPRPIIDSRADSAFVPSTRFA
mmetsp:Transcript_111376/g.265737  ORF Transcript_111376/g.265737 Transcript_111376/m.265737 type:complete len:318 (+) Transcript_111376:3495-4448(+)